MNDDHEPKCENPLVDDRVLSRSYEEGSIVAANEEWERLAKEVPALLAEVRRGKAIYSSQAHPVMQLATQLANSLMRLAKVDEDALKTCAAVPLRTTVLQRLVDDLIAEHIKEHHLDPALLEGDVANLSFTYRTTETVYSKDYERVGVPQRLLDAVPDFANTLRDKIYESDELGDAFSPECYDGEVHGSELEVEEG